MSHDPMTLDTTDPLEALRQIASYLRCVTMTRDRAIRVDGELVGYYQMTEFLEGLLEIANECDRICIESPDPKSDDQVEK